jgi:aspartate racemase
MKPSQMRRLGLIGGMSAESTTVYYQALNRLVRERLGGLHSADLLLHSLDFAPIAELQARDDWDATGAILAGAARGLAGAGAQAILICANTMHLNAPQVEAAVQVPLIHIADATAQALKARGVTRALLLATRFTMEKPFYAERLAAHGIETLTPDKADRDALHAIIYDELVVGVIAEASKGAVLAMIDKGRAAGCDGVIFGCTEIGLLLDPADMPLPTVDTAVAHCEAAIDFALG